MRPRSAFVRSPDAGPPSAFMSPAHEAAWQGESTLHPRVSGQLAPVYVWWAAHATGEKFLRFTNCFCGVPWCGVVWCAPHAATGETAEAFAQRQQRESLERRHAAEVRLRLGVPPHCVLVCLLLALSLVIFRQCTPGSG